MVRGADRVVADDAARDARLGATVAIVGGTPFRRAFDRSDGVRESAPSARASAASALAALKRRRASRRPSPSAGDAPVPSRSRPRARDERRRITRAAPAMRCGENESTRETRSASDGSGSIGGGAGGAPAEVSTKARAAKTPAGKTTDALDETRGEFGEFGATPRPEPRNARADSRLASDRAPKTTRTHSTDYSPVAGGGLGRGRVSGTETETEDAFGAPATRRRTFVARRSSSSANPARVSDDTHRSVTPKLPTAMRGANVPEGADVGPSALAPCNTCGRTFNARALEIHSRACAKVFAAKREAFDVAKQRAAGTDLERFRRAGGWGGAFGDDAGGFGGGSGPGNVRARSAEDARPRAGDSAAPRRAPASRTNDAGPGPAPKWKTQSERFRAGLRAGRMGRAVDTGHDEDLVPCPHCGRSFNERAAERHVPRCADVRAKPSRLARGGGRGARVAAKPGGCGTGRDYGKTRAF